VVSALHPTEIRLLPIPTCCRPPLGLSSSVSLSTTSTTHHPIPFYTDPSRMDTDEDGVTDYIELQGWDVIVIHERRGEVMEDLCKYGVWSLPVRFDSEGDGASDETEWKFHGNPDSSDSDKDGIPDREESGPNLTMVEGTPPVILDKKGRDKSSEKYSGAYIKTKVKIKTKWSISGVKIKGKIIVIFTVVDNAGLDRAVIYVQTGGERIIYLGRDKRREIEEVFEIGDLLRLIHGGYDVKVNVTDINGNWATGKTHIDSALQTLKKGLSALLDMIVAALKVIAKVASMLLEVIKKIVMRMLEPVLQPIKKGIKEYVRGIGAVISDGFSKYIEYDNRQDSHISEPNDLSGKILYAVVSGNVFLSIALLGLALKAINYIITGLTFGSSMAVGGVGTIIKRVVITLFVTGTILYLGLTGTISELLAKTIGTAIDENSEFWGSGFGLTIISIITALPNAITAFLSGNGVLSSLFLAFTGDGAALALAIAGLIIQVFLVEKFVGVICAQIATIVGFILATAGFAWALINDDEVDTAKMPLWWLEEVITGACFAYADLAALETLYCIETSYKIPTP